MLAEDKDFYSFRIKIKEEDMADGNGLVASQPVASPANIMDRSCCP